MFSTETFLLVVAVITFIGFAGNLLLNSKGIPQSVFLIAAGVFTHWLGVLQTTAVDAMLPTLSEVTLAMVVFDIGMSLNARQVVSQGRSAIVRSTTYMVLSITLITAAFTTVFGWGLYQSLFLGSIAGGEISMVIAPYMARRVSRKDLVSNLSLESVYDSMVLIILFFVFLTGYTQQAPFSVQGLTLISETFVRELSAGAVLGVLAGLLWVWLAKYIGRFDYFYIATVGYVLLSYISVGAVGGSGVIAVLAVGLVIRNLADLPSRLNLSVSLPPTSLNYLSTLQTEITFFLRTFFLFFLGFSVPLAALSGSQTYLLSFSVVGILLFSRYLSTEAADWKKSPRDRRFIESMMAQGLTPALLATTLVADSVSGAGQILSVAALVVLITNVVSTAGVRLFMVRESAPELESLIPAVPLVKELGEMVEGLGPDQLEAWVKTVEDDAKKDAPPAVRGVVALPRTSAGGADPGGEIKVSRGAIPYLIAAIEKNKVLMPSGIRLYFEELEALLARRIGEEKDLGRG
ncbi:MAG: cation:proton antiporter [Nitrososphaerota archaeon]|nr:cation:proton antiporter [Nitrososphaerota archaeon]MDG7022916.1 cation:proton antiporter [Nitrososphaerota archaeon]